MVRIHRAGEGASNAGLTDDEPHPIIAATDRALERGSIDELEQQLMASVRTRLRESFEAANVARPSAGDVGGGRAYVAAYVQLTHWVEGVFIAAEKMEEHDRAPSSHDAREHSVTSQDDAPIGAQRVAWILTGVLAMFAIIEGALLMRRPRGLRPLIR